MQTASITNLIMRDANDKCSAELVQGKSQDCWQMGVNKQREELWGGSWDNRNRTAMWPAMLYASIQGNWSHVLRVAGFMVAKTWGQPSAHGRDFFFFFFWTWLNRENMLYITQPQKKWNTVIFCSMNGTMGYPVLWKKSRIVKQNTACSKLHAGRKKLVSKK